MGGYPRPVVENTETRDVNSRGLRFDLPQGLKVGSSVEITMTLPHQVKQAGPIRVRCKGRVLRNNVESSGKAGVIAGIERGIQFLIRNQGGHC